MGLLLVGCASEELEPSIWPPPDFACVVEELQLAGEHVHVTRRWRVAADALVVYGTSSQPLVDAATGTSLPVFDRLSVYRLVPASLRSLARRLERLGIRSLEATQGERQTASTAALVLEWTAFGERRRLAARGRVHGPMAEILATVMAHLPPGERFGAEGIVDRPIVPVLRGVPAPRADVDGALGGYAVLLAERPHDSALLLEAFALACRAEQRPAAETLLQRWQQAEMAQWGEQGSFPDAPPAGDRLDTALLQRFLPAAARRDS